MTLRSMINAMPLPYYSMDTGGGGGDGGVEGDDFNDILLEGDDADILDGDDDGGVDFNSIFEDGEGTQDSGIEGEDGITSDATSILGDLFKTPDPPARKAGTQGNAKPGNQGGADDQNDPAAQTRQIQEQLTTQLQQGLQSLTIPEDMIPEDFNPSDPKALRALLGKVQQTTAQNAIRLMFAPVQVAMGQLATTLRAEIASKANSTVNESAATRLLEANVPAARDPALRPLVDVLFNQAKQRFPNDMRAQVRATRKAVAVMNLKSGSKTARGRSGDSTGQKALDLYAPMPGGNPRANGNGNGNRGNQPTKLNAAQRALLSMFASATGKQ